MTVQITLVIEADADGPELESRINELCAEIVADRLAGSEYPAWLTATMTEEGDDD
jgi:hypothetical protein